MQSERRRCIFIAIELVAGKMDCGLRLKQFKLNVIELIKSKRIAIRGMTTVFKAISYEENE